MHQLPVELRRLCFEFLDDEVEALRALRLVNKEFGELATEALFHTAGLYPLDESAEALTELMQSEHSKYVQRLTIHTSLGSDDPEEEAELLDSFAEAIGSLHSFESLQEVQVKFAVECAAELDTGPGGGYQQEVNETPEFRSAVLQTTFKALERVKTLKVLSITNLQDQMNRQILETAEFQSVRDRLTGLHLQILTEVMEQHDLDFAAVHQGFTIDLPELWLKPVLPHLTQLSLYSYTCMWGLYPFVDFRQVGTFPCLESLSLGNYTIAHEWQIDWILSHGPTLKQLLLDDCPIIPALRMAHDDNMARLNFPGLKGEGDSHCPYFKLMPLRWHQVFDRFRRNLPRLQHFAMYGSDCDWADDAFDDRYSLNTKLRANRYHFFNRGSIPHWLDPPGSKPKDQIHTFYRNGGHPNPEYWQVEYPQCYSEDLATLKKLIIAVGKRAGTIV